MLIAERPGTGCELACYRFNSSVYVMRARAGPVRARLRGAARRPARIEHVV
jgi:hypothetical protein